MSATAAIALAPEKIPSVRDKVSPEEWQTRVDLAACYRLVDHYGMSDLTGTHISARVPGEEGAFLINPYGLFFEEITASSLIKLDLDGNILSETEYPVNAAGYTIHSAVHAVRHDVNCALHTHTRAGMAVSSLKCGLLPMSQHAARFIDNIGYHDYEGVATNLDERERLQQDLGDNCALILRNHGLMSCGNTVAHAFRLIQKLEKACQAQIDGMAARTKVTEIAPTVQEHTKKHFAKKETISAQRDWPGLLRQLDRIDPSYKN
jgi:ribulose-5-phosphate 4-epimerase/fuculose-1-phosphate aldolase